MLAELARIPPANDRYLFWGVRTESDLLAYPDLEELCDISRTSLSIHVSSPTAAFRGPRSRIIAAVSEHLERLERPTIYLVGCTQMVQELSERLGQRVQTGRVHLRTESHQRSGVFPK